MGGASRYPAEVRDGAVRLVCENQGAYESQWAAISSIAGKIALRKPGHVVGVCEGVDVVGRLLSLAELRRNERRAGFLPTSKSYPKTYAWVLRMPGRLPKPVPYRHPSRSGDLGEAGRKSRATACSGPSVALQRCTPYELSSACRARHWREPHSVASSGISPQSYSKSLRSREVLPFATRSSTSRL